MAFYVIRSADNGEVTQQEKKKKTVANKLCDADVLSSQLVATNKFSSEKQKKKWLLLWWRHSFWAFKEYATHFNQYAHNADKIWCIFFAISQRVQSAIAISTNEKTKTFFFLSAFTSSVDSVDQRRTCQCVCVYASCHCVCVNDKSTTLNMYVSHAYAICATASTQCWNIHMSHVLKV